MGWWVFIILSMFPISLADNTFVNPEDTDVAIQQIHECLPSCSTGGELPSLGRPNPNGQSTFSTDRALIITGELQPPDNSDSSSASVHQALPCLTNGEDVIGEPPIRDLPRISTSATASSGSGTTNVGLSQSHHVIDIDQQQSGQASTGTETSTQIRYPTIGFSEPSTSYSSSSPLLFATNSSSVHPLFLLRDSLLPQNSETYRAINIELQRAQPLAGHLPDPDHVINSVPRDQPFKLGKTFLGLTFQAVLALMIFHFQGSSSSPSPSSPSSPPPSRTPSIPVEIVGASMAVGFTFTLIGILLRNPYPTVANISEYAGIFSAAFGFFVMTEMFLPESFSWTVWPTGVVVLLVFAFVLARMR